jgi:osmotically-inducible protein OsmY
VTLGGHVHDSAERHRVVAVARNVRGVDSVVDNLRIKQ